MQEPLLMCLANHVKYNTSSYSQQHKLNPTTNLGFTIIELLITIVVIGVLAAISIVAYTGVSQRAIVVSLQSDLTNSATNLKLYQVKNKAFPTLVNDCPTPAAANICLEASKNNSYSDYAAVNTTPQNFNLTVTNVNGTSYSITDDSTPLQVSGPTGGSSAPQPPASLNDDFNRTTTADGAGLGTNPGGVSWQVLSGSWRILSNQASSSTAASANPVAVVDGSSGNADSSVSVSSGGGDALYARVVDNTNWLRARVRTWQAVVSSYTYYTSSGWAFLSDYNYCGGWDAARGYVYLEYNSYINDYGYKDYIGYDATCPAAPNRLRIYAWRQHEVANTGYNYATNYQVILEKSVGGSITTLATYGSSAPSALRIVTNGNQITTYANGSPTALGTVTDAAFSTATKNGVGRGVSDTTGSALDNFTSTH